MATNIQVVYPEFDAHSFQNNINPKLPPLSLTERANLITEQLHAHLPKEYPAAIEVLLHADKLEFLEE